MVDIAGKVDPEAVRTTAADIVGDQSTTDDTTVHVHHLAALHRYVNENVTYAPDPATGNYIAPPAETLETNAGDCDCQAVLVASLFEAIGAETRVVLCESTDGDWHALTEVNLADAERTARRKAVPSLERYYSTGERSPSTFTWDADDRGVWFLADTAAGDYIGDGTALADAGFIQGTIDDGTWWWYNAEYQYPQTHSRWNPTPASADWFLDIDPAGYQTSTEEFATRIETELPGNATVVGIEWGSIDADDRDYGYGLLVNIDTDGIRGVSNVMLERIRHVDKAILKLNGHW